MKWLDDLKENLKKRRRANTWLFNNGLPTLRPDLDYGIVDRLIAIAEYSEWVVPAGSKERMCQLCGNRMIHDGDKVHQPFCPYSDEWESK